MSVSRVNDLHDEERDVVRLRRTGTPFLHDPHQGGKAFLERARASPLDRVDKALVPEEFTARVHRLDDTVGVKIKSVSWPNADTVFLVAAVAHADRQARRLEKRRHRPR